MMPDNEFVYDREKMSDSEIVEYNRNLCERFPFLKCDDTFESTWLDDMPFGWRVAFGEQMCEELKAELVRIGYLEQYQIRQIKEKFGTLHWYDAGYPKNSRIEMIIDKYEAFSEVTCIDCGSLAKFVSLDWISPYCEKCIGDTPCRKIEEHLR